MTQPAFLQVLTINTGSSSLKLAVYELSTTETRRLAAQVERIGLPNSRIRITDAHGAVLLDQQADLADHAGALQTTLDWLHQQEPGLALDAVGHRLVHGGSQYREPHIITQALVQALRPVVPLDPEHLPQSLAAIEAISQRYPTIPQVACFDTAFHRSMPQVAQMYPLPRTFWDAGVRRYGFHGLSCEFIMQELRAQDRPAAEGRVIIAHLGNGASMTAVRGGVSVETTMGFTPSGGLMMGTRAGDLDPGVPFYLGTSSGLNLTEVSQVLTRQSGLLGVSGSSADMRDVLAKAPTEPRAAEALALFCYQAKKFLGALTAVLGGLETLVFTGGIGEHAAPIRQEICAGLEFLGIQLDPARNAAHAPVISAEGSRVRVRVMPTNEDLMIARQTVRLL